MQQDVEKTKVPGYRPSRKLGRRFGARVATGRRPGRYVGRIGLRL